MNNIQCSRCGKILIVNVPDYNITTSNNIHLCDTCSHELGLDTCGCGKLMKIVNPYILNECDCGHVTRKQNI